MNIDKELEINYVLNQTNYNYETALIMLEKHNFDKISVIKDYLGIKPKSKEIKSINQEIYNQIRKQIDITNYINKNPLNLNHIISNIESENEGEK